MVEAYWTPCFIFGGGSNVLTLIHFKCNGQNTKQSYHLCDIIILKTEIIT